MFLSSSGADLFTAPSGRSAPTEPAPRTLSPSGKQYTICYSCSTFCTLVPLAVLLVSLLFCWQILICLMTLWMVVRWTGLVGERTALSFLTFLVFEKAWMTPALEHAGHPSPSWTLRQLPWWTWTAWSQQTHQPRTRTHFYQVCFVLLTAGAVIALSYWTYRVVKTLYLNQPGAGCA